MEAGNIKSLISDNLTCIANYLDHKSLLKCRLTNTFFKAFADNHFKKIKPGTELVGLGSLILIKEYNFGNLSLEKESDDETQSYTNAFDKLSKEQILNSFYSCQKVAIFEDVKRAQAYTKKVESDDSCNINEPIFSLIKSSPNCHDNAIPSFKYLKKSDFLSSLNVNLFSLDKVYNHVIFFVKVKAELIEPLSVEKTGSFIVEPELFEVLGYAHPITNEYITINSLYDCTMKNHQ